MAQITSAMAAKYLRKLNEEHDALLQKEKKSATYTVSVQEKPEDVRPEYDYAAVQFQLRELEDKIRKVKHAINQFNLTQDVPGFNMTIDQMLVYIPQLTARKNKLNRLRSRLPKERVQGGMSRMSGIVEYEYSNYDIKQAETDYTVVSDELAKAQNALDAINASVAFFVEIE